MAEQTSTFWSNLTNTIDTGVNQYVAQYFNQQTSQVGATTPAQPAQSMTTPVAVVPAFTLTPLNIALSVLAFAGVFLLLKK